MMWRRISRSGPRRTRLRQRGIALAMTLFTLVLLALAVATSTLIARPRSAAPNRSGDGAPASPYRRLGSRS